MGVATATTSAPAQQIVQAIEQAQLRHVVRLRQFMDVHGDHLHVERVGAHGDRPADVAQSDHAHGQAGKPHGAGRCRLHPDPLLLGAVEGIEAP